MADRVLVMDNGAVKSIPMSDEVPKFVGIGTSERKMRGMFMREDQGELGIGKSQKSPGVVEIIHATVKTGGIPFDRLGHVGNRNSHMMDRI